MATSALPTDDRICGLVAVANGRDALHTAEAARSINRQYKTLRRWASRDSGPIRPVRINGRLAWRVVDLQRLLEEGS